MGAFNRLIVSSETGLKTTADNDLLILISKSDENKILADRAFNEFHRRYVPYLFKVCYVACRRLKDGYQLAKDLVQDTFIQVYLSASTFNPKKGSSIKAWLGTIARNKFIDLLHQRKDYPISKSEDIDHSKVKPPEKNVSKEKIPKYRIKTDLKVSSSDLEEALDKIDQDKRHILMTYMLHHDIDNPDAHLPPGVMEVLCQIYNIDSSHIRQIKNRTLAELSKILKHHLS
ncbi:MAG: sigma-70 family RNA polymerase sigma factor [Bacteroidetes bacterium]|nr:sigma-70 family RNA polymerase sigma factor [Bacteroidota bacterium]